jgi:hypothetical protein
MHSNDLYQVANRDEERFMNLVNLFISAAGLPENTHVRRKVIDKCQNLINSSGENWVQEGVLVEVAGTRKKLSEFQTVWESVAEQFKTTASSPEQTPSVDFENSPRMSRCSSVSTNRGLSDDSVSGKVIYIYIRVFNEC